MAKFASLTLKSRLSSGFYNIMTCAYCIAWCVGSKYYYQPNIKNYNL